MRLTPEQQKYLIDKLNQIWPAPRKCPVCQNQQWNISDTIFELREFQEGNLLIGGDSRIYPVITVTCMNCGNTLFLNALSLEIVKPPAPKEQGGAQ